MPGRKRSRGRQMLVRARKKSRVGFLTPALKKKLIRAIHLIKYLPPIGTGRFRHGSRNYIRAKRRFRTLQQYTRKN